MSYKKSHLPCLSCGNEPKRSRYRYCSNTCQQQYQYEQYIRQWLAGEITGLQPSGIVTSSVKKYLRNKFNDKCCLCLWNVINSITGKVPLVADHIDGNWQNNAESKLRLLCPNCDSLTPTYGALNKGRGRKQRKPSKRRVVL